MKAYKRACLALEKIEQFQEMKAWAEYRWLIKMTRGD